jgi:type II secretory pathway component GspD/PulD (secretin)
MKKLVAAVALLASFVVHAAPKMPVPPLPAGAVGGLTQLVNEPKPVKVDFTGVTIAQLVALVYGEILVQPYVIEPAVLKDERTVSVRYDSAKGDIRAFWRTFLDSLGLDVTVRGGVDYVAQKKPEEKREPEEEKQPFVYRTKHRSTAYLVELLSPLFPSGGFAVNRPVRAPMGDKVTVGTSPPPPVSSAAALVDQESDTLIFQGTPKQIDTLGKLLAQVDVPEGEVLIKAVVYEVTTGNSDGSAFSLAVGLLGGKLGLSIGAADLDNAIRLRSASIEAAFSALASDSRFRAVSTPRVRVKSGSQAHLVVGDDVPTIGAVTVPQGGSQAFQSVDYRSSGVIVNFAPTVRESGIEIAVDQQISGFARTETGVNNSPTLTKRSLATRVTVSDGELIILGGLTQSKNTKTQTGLSFLPSFLRTSGNSDTKTEVLLMLQVDKISM